MNRLIQKAINDHIGSISDLPPNIQELLRVISDVCNDFEEKIKKNLEQDFFMQGKEIMRRAVHFEASQKIAHVGSWELDLSNEDNLNENRLYWSDETYRIFGFDPITHTITNDLFFERVHPDDIESIKTAVSNTLKTGEIYNIEHRIILPDGMQKIVHERAELIYHPKTSAPLKMIGTVQDITDRKLADIALQNRDIKFKALIQKASDGITVADENSTIFFASDSVLQVTGYSPEEIIGHQPAEFIHPEDIDDVRTKHKELLGKPGASMTIMYRRKKKNDGYIWVENTVTNLLHEPNVKGTIANFRDVTARVLATQALKDSEYSFRSLIENSTDAIAVMNAEFQFIYASDSIYRVTGYRPDELIGLPALSFVYPEDIELLHDNIQKVMTNPGTLITAKYRRLHKSGRYFWCEGTANNLLQTPVNGIVVNFRDITERMEYEEALRKSNEDLQKSNKELDRFVYSVSHDLRAPLSSMLGIVYLMEEEAEQDVIIEDLKLLKSSINKLDGFINDILNYSKNARVDIGVERINFKQLCEDITHHLKYMNSEGNPVNISVTIVEKEPFYSDYDRLHIIFSNLVSNAIRYSNPNIDNPYVKIHVVTEQQGAIIKVQDNGIGISKENYNKIFEMFYRISNKSKGSGLGLYIVQEVVTKLKGSISIDSQINEGSLFTVQIPSSKITN